MTTNSRKAIESPIERGTTETNPYGFDSALVDEDAVAPTLPTDVLYDETYNDKDMSSTLLTGSVTVDGTVITARAEINLLKDHVYRHVVEWGPVGNRVSIYWQVYGTL